MTFTTTLAKIRADRPCSPGWKKLRRKLGRGFPNNRRITIARIVRLNGAADAVWCLAHCGVAGLRLARELALEFAEHVQGENEAARQCNAVTRRYLAGKATMDALRAAIHATRDNIAYAAFAARTAAFAAVDDDAAAAARAAAIAGTTERRWQVRHMIERLKDYRARPTPPRPLDDAVEAFRHHGVPTRAAKEAA